MIHCVWGPALHSPVAPIATRIVSFNAGERGPSANAKCGNYIKVLKLALSSALSTNSFPKRLQFYSVFIQLRCAYMYLVKQEIV